jgi:DNA-binding beta-propeller fold protein YncE
MTRSAPPVASRLARIARAARIAFAACTSMLPAGCAAPAEMVHTDSGNPVGRGTLLVVNAAAASVSFLDALTGDRIIDLPVGEGPGDVAVAPGGAIAVVANHGGAVDGHTLSVIDVTAAAVSGTIELGQHGAPCGMQFAADGRRLLVASGATGRLLVIDIPSRRLVRAVSTGQAHAEQLALQPDGRRVWISHGAAGVVSVVDVDRLVVLKTLETGAGAEGLLVSPDGKDVWVCDQAADNLAIIDATDLRVTAHLPCSSGP